MSLIICVRDLLAQSHTPTLWAGTNAGTVLIYQLTVPSSDKRNEDIVQCILGMCAVCTCLTKIVLHLLN